VECVGHVVYFGASRCETSIHYFSCSGGPGAVCIQKVTGYVTSNMCFCIR
jgi:hypothetical protein